MIRPTLLAVALTALGFTSLTALAGPTGGNVVAGNASIRTNGTQTDIVQTSSRAVIDWNQFNIGRGESVHFRQPDTRSSTLNRVTGGDPSQILGTLTATGQVILLNPNGVLFGRESRVDTAGLIVSTAKLGTEDFMAGRLNFSASDRAGGSIVNQGTITVREGGLAAFVAPHVRNDGAIHANLGRVMLASGSSFTIDLAGDGLVSLAVRDADLRGLVDAQGRPVATLVENTGSITAQSGKIVLMTPAFAAGLIDNAINLGGIVRADTIERDKSGAIVLAAANGNVSLPGEIAAPGGAFTLRRDTALLSIEGDTAAALGRVLRTGTNVDVESTGRIDVASRVDGRGGAAGAGLRLTAASIGIREDLYTLNGAVGVKATAGAAEMLRPTTEIAPGRSWPLIMTGSGDIRLEATGNVLASHLVTTGNVHIESAGGNVNMVASLGGDLGGTSPLASLTVRALGKPDARDVGNVSEMYDVIVAAGGKIDIAASRNIQLFATGTARAGINDARNGVGGRSLRMASDRLGSGDLTTNAFYWTGNNSRARHIGRGTSPEDAAGRWTNLQLTAKEAGNPTAGAPPGPTSVLALAPAGGSGLTVLTQAPERAPIPDVIPVASLTAEPVATTTASTVTNTPATTISDSGAGTSTTASVGSSNSEPRGVDRLALASVTAGDAEAPNGADAGYSANRGIAQLADTGRVRGTESPKDVFAIAEHVVEVPVCSNPTIGGNAYFARGAFGQTLGVACR